MKSLAFFEPGYDLAIYLYSSQLIRYPRKCSIMRSPFQRISLSPSHRVTVVTIRPDVVYKIAESPEESRVMKRKLRSH